MADDPFSYSGKLAFLRRVCVDPRLQRTAVAVAAVIIDHAHKTTGQTHISVATIVAESGVPKSTALRSLRRLEELGWLKAEKRFGTSSNYTLTGVTVGTGSDAGTGVIWNATSAIQNLRKGQTSPDVGAGPVPTPGHKQEELKATGKEQVPGGVIFGSRFEEFWVCYPRKEGKGKAEKAWKARKLDNLADKILTDLVARNRQRQWPEPKYIPLPFTYLSERRWEDEWHGARAGGTADAFHDTTYTGTPDSELPDYLRPTQ